MCIIDCSSLCFRNISEERGKDDQEWKVKRKKGREKSLWQEGSLPTQRKAQGPPSHTWLGKVGERLLSLR